MSYDYPRTPNLRLWKPRKGGQFLSPHNENAARIDGAYGDILNYASDMPEVYILSGTFNGPTGTTVSLPKSVDSADDYTAYPMPSSRSGAIGDIWIENGTSSFVVKCAEANTTDTFKVAVYYDSAINGYGSQAFRAWYVTPVDAGADHSLTSLSGGLADILTTIGSGPATVILPGNHNYSIDAPPDYTSPGIMSFDSATRTITDLGGDFVTKGFVAGMPIEVDGSASNDGEYVIESVGASTIVVTSGYSLVDESLADASVHFVIPSWIELKHQGGAKFLVASGKTLYINASTQGAAIQRYTGDGTVKIKNNTILIDWWGQASAEIEKAFGSCTLDAEFKFSPKRIYTINATVECPWNTTNARVSVLARGAYFNNTVDDIGFNLNPTYVAPGTNQTRRITWLGGAFYDTSAGTASECFRSFGVRELHIAETRINSFWAGIRFAKGESTVFEENHIYHCTKGIALINGDQGNNGTQNTKIQNNVITGEVGVSEAAVWLDDSSRSILLAGNVIAGGFTYADYYISDRRTVGSGYNKNLRIIWNHHETNNTMVWVKHETGYVGYYDVTIHNNNFGSSQSSPVLTMSAIKLETVIGADFRGNDFSCANTAIFTAWDPDANCQNIRIGPNTYDYAGAAGAKYIGTSYVRSKITWEPEYVKGNGILGDYNGTQNFTADGTELIDMSAEYGSFPDFLPPKAYHVRVRAKDSGCESATAYVKLTESATTNDRYGIDLNLTKNDVWFEQFATIPCTISGELYLDYKYATQLNIVVAIVGYQM